MPYRRRRRSITSSCGSSSGRVAVVVVVGVVVTLLYIYVVGYNLVHVGHRAIHIYVHVDHRAIGFLAGFRNLTVQGRCCRNFVLTVLCFFFL